MGIVPVFLVPILGSEEILPPVFCVYTTAVTAMGAGKKGKKEKENNEGFFHTFWLTGSFHLVLWPKKVISLRALPNRTCCGVQQLRPPFYQSQEIKEKTKQSRPKKPQETQSFKSGLPSPICRLFCTSQNPQIFAFLFGLEFLL